LYPVTLRTDGADRLRRFAASTKAVRWISVTDECGVACVLPNSRLSKATRPALSAMIVVVDARQLTGIHIGELSYFVSLVALTNPPADDRSRPNSILDMFGGPKAGADF